MSVRIENVTKEFNATEFLIGNQASKFGSHTYGMFKTKAISQIEKNVKKLKLYRTLIISKCKKKCVRGKQLELK